LSDLPKWLDTAGSGHIYSDVVLYGVATVTIVALGVMALRTTYERILVLSALAVLFVGWGYLAAWIASAVLLLVAARIGNNPKLLSGFAIAVTALAATAPVSDGGMGLASHVWIGGSGVRDPVRWFIPFGFGLAVIAWQVDWKAARTRAIAGFALFAVLVVHVDIRGMRDQVSDGIQWGAEERWRPRAVDVILRSLPVEAHIEIPMAYGDAVLLPSCFIHGHKIVNGYARYLPNTHRVLVRALNGQAKTVGDSEYQLVAGWGVRCWVISKQATEFEETLVGSLGQHGLTVVWEDRDYIVLLPKE
jgi:hypothetical protein